MKNKKLKRFLASSFLFLGTFLGGQAIADIYCWSLTCQQCTPTFCSEPFKMPESACSEPNVHCPDEAAASLGL